MRQRLKNGWQRTPTSIRKPVVLVTGLLFIIAAGATGWLPGPGGIPLFLIGIAILATEYAWADRIKNVILDIVHGIGRWYRANKVLGTIVFAGLACVSFTLMYLAYSQFVK